MRCHLKIEGLRGHSLVNLYIQEIGAMYGGYPYPPPNPRDFIKAMRDWEEWEHVKSKKKKEHERNWERKRGLSGMETFLILTLISPLIGPLYLMAIVAAAHRIAEMLLH